MKLLKLAFLVFLTSRCGAQCVAYTYASSGSAGSTSSLTSITYNGFTYAQHLNYAYINTATIGGHSYGFSTPTSGSIGTSPDYTQVVFQPAGATDQFTIRSSYSLPSCSQMRIDIAVTNNDVSDSITQFNVGNVLSFLIPSAAAQPVDSYHPYFSLSNNFNAPIIYLSTGGGSAWGSLAMWLANPSVNGAWSASYGTPNQTAFQFGISGPKSSNSVLEPTVPLSIAPGGSITISVILQFAATVVPAATLAAPGIAGYIAVYPFLPSWPDRRPIGSVYISAGAGDYTNHSATNPRGYFNEPALNAVGDPAALIAAEVTFTNRMIAALNARNPKPQGVIIWDPEGTEFAASFSYVGDPSVIQYIAPEGPAVIDDMVSRLHAAGYQVGFTIRPNNFAYGTTLPGTCAANANYLLQDVFIKTDAVWPNRGYICSSTNTWTAVNSNAAGPQVGWQKFPSSLAAVKAVMESKINYAISRWNAKWFYADSVVDYPGNSIQPELWSAIAADYPGVMFFPEQWFDTTLGYTNAFMSGYALGQWSTAAILPGARLIFPGAFSFVSAGGVLSMSTQVQNTVTQGIATGDIYSYQGWYDAGDGALIDSLHAAAATLNSSVLIQDTATSRWRSFSASPATAYTYPLVLRVYFASSAAGLPTSTTYCEQRGTVSCWQAGTPTGATSLSLSGMTNYEMRYYDFAGTKVQPASVPGNL